MIRQRSYQKFQALQWVIADIENYLYLARTTFRWSGLLDNVERIRTRAIRKIELSIENAIGYYN